MYYNVQVSPYSDFSELAYNQIVEDVTFEVITYGLASNTLYYWRVKSINNLTGKESVWSSACSFITRADDIVIGQSNINDVNVIIYESGNNRVSTCFAPDGIIGDVLCRSTTACCDAIVGDTVIGSDTLGNSLCGQHCSELL